MINEMLTAGMLYFGVVDYVNEKQARVEFKIGQTYQHMDVSIENSACTPDEGMEVLFSSEMIVKCFCSDKSKKEK